MSMRMGYVCECESENVYECEPNTRTAPCRGCQVHSFVSRSSLPSFHAIVLLHLLHVAMFEYFCAKYSHTFDHLPRGIFSVKRLMASFVCACLLFTVIRLLL